MVIHKANDEILGVHGNDLENDSYTGGHAWKTDT
jgi:hypothetical protein